MSTIDAHGYAHTLVHSCFSLLSGDSWPEALVDRAAELGFTALALTDRMSVSGAVRLQRRAEARGLRAVVGAELLFEDGDVLVVLARTASGYRHLNEMLTEVALGGGEGRLRVEALAGREGLWFLAGGREGRLGRALLRGDLPAAEEALRAQLDRIPRKEDLRLVVVRDALPGNRRLEEGTERLARRFGIPVMAAHPVRHRLRSAFWVHDLLSCIRLRIPLEAGHAERPLNAERYLKSPKEMAELFRDRPEWLAEAGAVVAACRPPFTFGTPLHPDFPLPPGEAPEPRLRRLVYEGARSRYGRVGRALAERIEHELAVVVELGFADYFLLVADVVRFARSRGIRVSGRGSAADSVIAYCLGLTEVDAFSRRLLFERFLSRERRERPDVDLDFDYRHRDLVIRYLEERHGREHVARIATYQTFRARSAVRALGPVLGIPGEEVERLAKRLPWGLPADAIAEAWTRLPELAALDPGRSRVLVRAAAALAGLPHHLGTHLGGVVVARPPILRLGPRQRSAKGEEVLPFDKEDVEALGLFKLDLLSLRALAVLEDGEEGGGARPDRGRFADGATYARIARGETVGVFQLESPAQRALQPRLRPRRLEDLVHAVALIRPGPIQGDMVHPYLRRRFGEEAVAYLDPTLRPILAKTYGVVLFQEQVIEVARAIAGFSPGEADQLRRVMTHARSQGQMREIGETFVRKAVARGVAEATARAVFRMLAGYASYGFPEAHAAAFAQLAYESAHLAEHDPPAFFAGLLSHQPMGYYPLHTLATEARRRGVELLPPDVNRSEVGCRVEGRAVRLGLALVAGVGRFAERLVAARAEGPYRSPQELWERTGLPRRVYTALCLAGALDGFSSNRRSLVHAYGRDGLFVAAGMADYPEPRRGWLEESVLPLAGPSRLFAPLRARLEAAGVRCAASLAQLPAGERVRVAGLPVRPHRPPTRSGKTVVFFSLEDESGFVDVVVFPEAYRACGQWLFRERALPLLVDGVVEHRGGGAVSLQLRHARPLSPPGKA